MAYTSTRREARERALTLAYELDQRDISADELLTGLPLPADPYAQLLVRGVDSHVADLDALLNEHAKNWSIDRMPVIDRTLLRLATYELVHETDLATGVVINEAVELAKQYSTKDSGRFINGLLSRIAQVVRGETVESGEIES
jgi:transcription antitermination protein NusB